MVFFNYCCGHRALIGADRDKLAGVLERQSPIRQGFGGSANGPPILKVLWIGHLL